MIVHPTPCCGRHCFICDVVGFTVPLLLQLVGSSLSLTSRLSVADSRE